MEWCLHNIFSHLMISSPSKMKILHSNWLFLAIVILTAMVVSYCYFRGKPVHLTTNEDSESDGVAGTEEEPSVIVQLSNRVQDGTRCRIGSLDMCIQGKCQVCFLFIDVEQQFGSLGCHSGIIEFCLCELYKRRTTLSLTFLRYAY